MCPFFHTQRNMPDDMKRCSHCKSEKPETEFGKDKSRRDGLNHSCLACCRKASAKIRERNPEKARKASRECVKRRRDANPEAARAYHRKWYASQKNNPEFIEQRRLSASKCYYANREARVTRQTARMKRKLSTDPALRLEMNLRTRISGLLRYKGRGSARTLELLGCSIGRLMEYLKAHFKPGMTFDNYGREGWHVDHIKPCKLFDLSDPEQQKQCFNWLNLQPLWATENLKKGARYG